MLTLRRVLLIVLACGIPALRQSTAQPPELTVGHVAGLAKRYFRDLGELPMNVRTTKVVTDANGKLKRRSESSFRIIYQGWSTVPFSGGLLHAGTVLDSMSCHYLFHMAMLALASSTGAFKGAMPPAELDISPMADLVAIKAPDSCRPEFARNWLVPQNFPPCASYQYFLTGVPPTDLVFERFRLDLVNLPVPAKLLGLGDVQVRGFRTEGDFQKVFLPADPQPYLLPRVVVTSVDTDEGRIELTNRYSLRAAR